MASEDGSEDHLAVSLRDAGSCSVSRQSAREGRRAGDHRGPKHTNEPPADEIIQYVVIARFDDSYLRTCPGIVRFVQMVCSLIALVCVTSSGNSDFGGGSYLLLPLNWHLRAYVFVTVLGFLISFMVLLIQLTRLIEMLPLNWDIFDTVVYSILAFLYLFGASLVASAVDYYQTLDVNVSQWSIEQLIVSVVLGYLCLFLYGSTAFMGYRRHIGLAQFERRRFSSNSSQMITRSSNAPSSQAVMA